MRRTYLIALIFILLAAVILAISIYDIVNANGWRTSIFIAYGILLVSLVGIILVSRWRPARSPPETITIEKQFRCPSCHGTFQLAVPSKQTTLHHVCPHCGYLGSITLPSKK